MAGATGPAGDTGWPGLPGATGPVHMGTFMTIIFYQP